VIGEFSIEHILEMPPREMWEATHTGSGIERDYFFEYFKGRERAFALKVRSAVRYETPLRLIEHLGMSRPPQSFCYVYSRDISQGKRRRSVAMRARSQNSTVRQGLESRKHVP
jgi:hypothetical protein